jgi:hypothetical protein
VAEVLPAFCILCRSEPVDPFGEDPTLCATCCSRETREPNVLEEPANPDLLSLAQGYRLVPTESHRYWFDWRRALVDGLFTWDGAQPYLRLYTGEVRVFAAKDQ